MFRLSRWPWFKLRTHQDDVISGQITKDKELILQMESGWDKVALKLSAQEAESILSWMNRALKSPEENRNDKATVIQIRPRPEP